MSLALEALTQAFEPRRSHEFTLRGFTFQEKLPAMNTDEILEVQTCIQPFASRAGEEQAYLVVVESVRDGQWTTHCEGTAVVGTNLNHNGLALQTNGSNLHKLKKSSSRTTTLDRITREDSDPYQLHPLTIYRCLQHALASTESEEHCGGVKIAEVKEFKLWSSEERKSVGQWTVHAVDNSGWLEDQEACVDVDLQDEAGNVTSTFKGLQVVRCEGETHEAFDINVPPPERNARVPAFLRPLLK